MQLEGSLKFIGQSEQVSQSFTKRDVVIMTEESSQYPQPILVQFTQDKCDLLNGLQIGEKVKISVNLRGKEYQDKQTGQLKYFNTIQGWKIDRPQAQQQGGYNNNQQQQGFPPAPNYNNNGQGF